MTFRASAKNSVGRPGPAATAEDHMDRAWVESITSVADDTGFGVKRLTALTTREPPTTARIVLVPAQHQVDT